MLFNKPASVETIKRLRKLDSNITTINVYGYNSSRFDSNLFKSYLNYEFNSMRWTVSSPIGMASVLKQFILTSNQTNVKFRFVDAQQFVAGVPVQGHHEQTTTRDYLLHYNDTDVMIQPLINLIDMNACYRIDIQHNLSLSQNSSAIKYMLAYKGFDPTIDYVVTTSEVTFKPTLKWWTHKCASY